MSESLKILLPLFAGVLVLLAVVRLVVASLARRTREEVRRRLAGRPIVRESLGANFFGLSSRGLGQVRGNGALVLTPDQICFLMFAPRREVTIPLRDVTRLSTPRSHLGKTVGMRLLKVDFTSPAGPDAAAWAVRDLDGWVADVERCRRG